MGILSAFRFAFQNLFFTPVLYGVIASLAVFSSTWEKGDRIKDQFTDKMRSQQDTFDFIVVGGGVSGAVLANRLSQYHTVLLLEAGGESHPFQAIPGLSLFLNNYPETDWQHKTVTQVKSCFACNNQQASWSAGRNLGGGGNINYLIHLRGSPKDYDNWAAITGDPSWSYEGVLPFFKKSENYIGNSPDSAAHAIGGELQIESPDYIGLAPEWNHAGKELGYPHADLNGHYEEGFDTVFYPIKQGVRQATYRAFIQPCRGRGNLVIRKFAHVNKLLIRERTNEIHGVQYDRHGYPRYAFANNEVILSAGAVNSPKILMLSGIGPWKNLEDCGIDVKSDLPVGQNLQDHVSTLLGPFLIKYPRSLLIDRDITPKSFLEFGNRGTGPLSSSGFQATALITSSLAKSRGEILWPDTQLTLFGVGAHRLFPSDMAHAFGITEDIFQKYTYHALNKDSFFILVSAARPAARGDITLVSQDPYKSVAIDPKYLCDQGDTDLKVLVEGIKTSLFLVENTTAFQQLGAEFTWKKFPACEDIWFRSDEYWECYIRQMTVTLNDATGTCAMGPRDSPNAVVDPELKVIGVNNLRVVDASIMPRVVGANTQAAAIMIGEKGAALILDQWKGTARALPYDGKNGNNLIDGGGHENHVPHNGFSNVPVKKDDFAKLFDDDPANFDSYGPLQKALQNPKLLNIDPARIYDDANHVPNIDAHINTQIQPPSLLQAPPSFTQGEFVVSSTPSGFLSSPATPTSEEFFTVGSSTHPGLESTVSSILSTPIPRQGKGFDFTQSPQNQLQQPPEGISVGDNTTPHADENYSTSQGSVRGQNVGTNGRRKVRRRKRPRSKVEIHPRAGFGIRVRRPKNFRHMNNSQVYLDALRRPNIQNQVPIVYDYFLDEGNPARGNFHALQRDNKPIRVYVRHVGSPLPDSESFKKIVPLTPVLIPSSLQSTSNPLLVTTEGTTTAPRQGVPKIRERGNRRNVTRLVVKPKSVNRPKQVHRPRARKVKPSVLLNMNQDVGNDLEIGASTNFAHSPPTIHSFVPIDMDPMPTIYATSDTVDEDVIMRNFSHVILIQ